MKTYKDIVYKEAELRVLLDTARHTRIELGDRRDADGLDEVEEAINDYTSQLKLIKWILS